jgi:hypothetical protein
MTSFWEAVIDMQALMPFILGNQKRKFSRPKCQRACPMKNKLFVLLVLSLSVSSYGTSALFGASSGLIASSPQINGLNVRSAGAESGEAFVATAQTSSLPQSSQPLIPTLQRGKVLADDFNELDLLQAYREIQSEYRQKAFNRPNDWRVLSTLNPNKDNTKKDEIIQVSIMEHPSDPLCPYVKMEAVLPVSVKDCWNFLLLDRWDETMPKMDPFYEGVDTFGEFFVHDDDTSARQQQGNKKGQSSSKAAVLHPRLSFGLLAAATSTRIHHSNDATSSSSAAAAADDNAKGIHMILARKRTKRILTFGKREFVFLSVKDEPLEDGTWVSGTVSVHSPTKIPRTKAYTRAFQDSIAFYKPLVEKERNPRTRLTIVCRIDLNDSSEDGAGGWIPMWLYVKTIGATGVRSVMNMRKALLEEQNLTK